MGDRRKGKGKTPRGNGANTRDYTSHVTAQSSSSYSDQGITDPVEFLEFRSINEQLEKVAYNQGSRSKFVTLNSLEHVWQSENTLGRFLAILGLGQDIFLLDDVTKNLIKTISILAAIGWKKWDTFRDIFLEGRGGSVRHDRDDRNLPYSLRDLEGQEGDPFLGSYWAGKFLAEQSIFIPIVIKEGGNEIYREGRPLPFIRSKTVKLKEGGYGSVTKEVIACHHFQSKNRSGEPFLHPKETSVARKRFPARGDFKKEARNLADLNSSLADHKRIVPYLAVFTVEDEEDQGASKEFNIILPLADADLQQFLYEKNFEGAWNNVVDVIKEASNLASAVKWLHEGQTISGKVLVCCHMDIKLDNVLVYLKDNPPVGWWKISDFGISSLQERKRELAAPRRPTSALLTVPTMSPAESLRIITAQIKTSVKRPAGAFSAPEVEAGEDVGPESDIFSFGCILFQVLARVAGGIPLLKKLDEKRASFENGSRNDHFCQRVGGGKALHKDVNRWLKSPDGLRGSLSDRSMVMNCKGLIGKTLEIASDARPSAAKLHDELVKIARGEGQKYYFDQHSNVVSNVPQSPTSKEKPVDGPQIRITPSQPEQETQDRMSVSTMNMPTSPPISPQPIHPSEITLQPFQPTSQPLPTPPPDIEHQDSPGTVQSGPMPAILMSRPPPRRPDHPPAPNFYNNQAPNVADFEPTSTPVPLQHTPMSFPRQRSRQDSAHTTHSSVHDVEAQRSEKGELIPFTAPQEVTSTLVSSTRKKIIFIAPKEAVVYTLYSPYSRKTIFPPQNCKWQKGSLAGNFIALCSVSERHNTQKLHLFKLSLSSQQLAAHEIHFDTELPYFEKFAVSMDGRLLLGRSNGVRLYASCGTDGNELQIPRLAGSKLQRVWFSTNGLLALSWFSLPGNLHHVRIWDVVDTNKSGVLKYQIPASDNSASAVKNIVHFPSSPMCIVWKEHDVVSLLQNPEPPQSVQVAHSPHLKNLQAIVVAPNEEAVVFIRWSKNLFTGFQSKSKISIGRIERVGGYKVLGSISEEEDLQYSLEKPAKCDVVIEEHTNTNTKVRVLIAHSNGNFEVKDVNLPGGGGI